MRTFELKFYDKKNRLIKFGAMEKLIFADAIAMSAFIEATHVDGCCSISMTEKVDGKIARESHFMKTEKKAHRLIITEFRSKTVEVYASTEFDAIVELKAAYKQGCIDMSDADFDVDIEIEEEMEP